MSTNNSPAPSMCDVLSFGLPLLLGSDAWQ